MEKNIQFINQHFDFFVKQYNDTMVQGIVHDTMVQNNGD
jgi:hypothetical protein